MAPKAALGPPLLVSRSPSRVSRIASFIASRPGLRPPPPPLILAFGLIEWPPQSQGCLPADSTGHTTTTAAIHYAAAAPPPEIRGRGKRRDPLFSTYWIRASSESSSLAVPRKVRPIGISIPAQEASDIQRGLFLFCLPRKRHHHHSRTLKHPSNSAAVAVAVAAAVAAMVGMSRWDAKARTSRRVVFRFEYRMSDSIPLFSPTLQNQTEINRICVSLHVRKYTFLLLNKWINSLNNCVNKIYCSLICYVFSRSVVEFWFHVYGRRFLCFGGFIPCWMCSFTRACRSRGSNWWAELLFVYL